jgi:hypothetical protein
LFNTLLHIQLIFAAGFKEYPDYTDADYEDPVENKEQYCLSFLITARVLHIASGTPPRAVPLLGLAFPAIPDNS